MVVSVKSTLTDSFEIVDKADILDTSPEDDRYEDISKDVDEVKRDGLLSGKSPKEQSIAHGIGVTTELLNENEKKALDALNYNTQTAPHIVEEDEEPMEVGSDRVLEEKDDQCDDDGQDHPYSYGMQFEREHDFDDEDIAPNYGDLYTHHEEDEETFEVDTDAKVKLSDRLGSSPAEFDTLAGRKFFSKSGEHDDASTSSLQEFEHFEAEMASGRKSSTSSADSVNCRQVHSKSGEHDDVSMNSLTEFEKLERECTEVEKTEVVSKEEFSRLTGIDEGHESQDSEASQETLSGNEDESDDNDSDDYEKRMSEIEEIIKQAQTNVEKFQTEGSETLRQAAQSGTFSGTGSTESSLLGQSPSPKRREDSLEDEAKCLYSMQAHKKDQSENVVTTSALPRHLLAERTISGHSIESWESLPKSSASTATQYDTESLRDQDLDVDDGDLDYLHEKRHLSDKDSDDDLAPDSLHDPRLMDPDSLRDRSHDIDSLEEERTAMQDSLYSVKDLEHDEYFGGDYRQKQISGRETSMSDNAQLRKEMESILLDSSLKGDCMVSSTDSLEPSSSTATHATYQFETDSIMSSSINSAQTSGEESTMVSSTDTVEPEPKTYYSYSESDSFKTVISTGDGRHSSDLDASTVTSTSIESGDSATIPAPLVEDSWYGHTERSEIDPQQPVVEEVKTVDDKGNVIITRKMKRIVVVDPQAYSGSSSGVDTEERMREFLKHSTFSSGSGEEEMEEQRSIDETGNVTITRTIKRHVLSEPHVHTQTFTGPDAELQSQEFVKSFEKILPREDIDDYEDTDEHGNIIKVSQQVFIQPEVHTITFAGPDAHEQMEEYMRSCSAETAYHQHEDIKQSSQKGSSSHTFPSHDANSVTASAPPSSVSVGSHMVTGFSNQTAQHGTSADSNRTEEFNRGGMEEVQIQNNFWIDPGNGTGQQLGTTVVTTRTTTRVFPSEEEEVNRDTSYTMQEDDQLRRSMQDILDQFMEAEAKEK